MFGNKAQMQNMLKKARKMQEDMQKIQEELKQQTVDVSVGGFSKGSGTAPSC